MYEAFMAFDYEGNGSIAVYDIQKALDMIGEPISQNDMYRMIA